MIKQIRNKLIIVGVLLLVLFSISNSRIKEEVIETGADSISNKKIEWGIKRSDEHKQPQLGEYNKKVLTENQGMAIGNAESKKVYLTFDEGYEAGYTEKILETLKNNNVKACFFITAHYVNTSPELVEKMINEGHMVGNHTANHKSMPELSDEELKKEVMDLHYTLSNKFKYDMKYLRPPKGEFSERTIKLTNNLGYKTVMWSFAYEDWNENNQPDESKSKDKILKNIHNGEIMLLHGNSKTNTNILDEIIKETKNMGYEFCSLDDFEY